MKRKDGGAQREAEFLVEEGAGVVAGDIPAVAFAAAARAGVPSFGVGNSPFAGSSHSTTVGTVISMTGPSVQSASASRASCCPSG